jgi:hypothetical protein
MEDDFYATIKLVTGEEIFSKVSVCEEENRTLLLLSNPIVVEEIKMKKYGTIGWKVESWLKTTDDDMFIIDMNKVMTITENNNVEIISVYHQYVRESSSEKESSTKETLNRKMGYISSVIEAKEILEKLYKI